jgi:RNA polymerase sigma-32 factor
MPLSGRATFEQGNVPSRAVAPSSPSVAAPASSPRLRIGAETENELAAAWRRGDRAAGRRLVEACLPFVMTIALEYRRWGVPLDDLLQEGCIGLLKAIDRFDPERGCRLATYAAYWIRAEIREHVVRGYRIVRLGTSKAERRALRIYRKTREQDPAALARLSGLSEERTTELLPMLTARDVSLDAVSPWTGNAAKDRIAVAAPNPEDAACAAAERDVLQRALASTMRDLSPRERRIVKKRWLTDSPVTLEELGQEFGVSKERVRQLEERTRNRVRARIEEIAGETALSLSA